MINQNQSIEKSRIDLKSLSTGNLLGMISHCNYCCDSKGNPCEPPQYPNLTYLDFRDEMDYRIVNARTIEEFIANRF